jgi:hypothetical protein
VTGGLAANPDPPAGTKRDYDQRRSNDRVTAFGTQHRSILRFMYDLDVPLTTTRAERDLLSVKPHRKISGRFRSQLGAERIAHLRRYLSTTRKNGIPDITALTELFEGLRLDAPCPAGS